MDTIAGLQFVADRIQAIEMKATYSNAENVKAALEKLQEIASALNREKTEAAHDA